MNQITPSLHRSLDFATVAGFALAPTIFSFAGTAAYLAYALAAIHLAMTLLTRFRAEDGQPVPLHLHGYVELVVGIALVVIPLLLGWQGSARAFFIAVGVVILAVWMLTAYKHTPART